MVNRRLKTTVKGHGRTVASWRDLGREGHGGEYAGASPWARQGIFIQGHKQTATRESGPGLPLERRDKLENPALKTRHQFLEVGWLCLHCNMLREGHDRAMEKLGNEGR